MAAVRAEVDGRVLALTNLDKELFPDGTTKAEVIAYYSDVAAVMIPHLAGRAVTRLRFPDGTATGSFFEKNTPAGTPDWVEVREVVAATTPIAYPVVDSRPGLVWLANLAALELHTPQWRFEHQPASVFVVDGEVLADLVVIDLDPGPGVTMADSARAALLLAAELAGDGLVPVPRTSGGKGLQLQAAVAPTPARGAVGYVRALAGAMAARHPDLFVTTQAKVARQGRILIDWLQNQPVRNTITSYSLRGRERPTVATPLSWDEVGAAAEGAPLAFSPSQVLERISDSGDLAGELLAADRPTLRVPPEPAPAR
ncbi:MAG: non-homologous end-joining DNA ligase [Propionicimonas sp.]